MNLLALILTNLKSPVLVALAFIFAFSCEPRTSSREKAEKQSKSYILDSPSVDEIFSESDTLKFSISSLNNIIPDSIHVLADGKPVSTEMLADFNIPCKGLISKYGNQNLRIRVYFSDSLTQILTARIIILPDNPPAKLNYTIIGRLPHNPESFTQGLVYYKGNLYEGTGQWGKSKILKIDPADGSVMLERKLENDLFGEGIVIHDEKIFQLTYKSMLGFVYDLKSFERIREFDLQTSEGWGLTSDGKALIVSDGSYSLYFYDPEYFSQKNQLEVCDNDHLISYLNELEWVNGSIWANVYGEKYILKIDAQTGKVLARLDLTGIFPKGIPDDMSHVLNGIAYNSDHDTYYLTGKLWPVLYEIKIMP